MIKNNRWQPEIPRPELTGEVFDKFLAEWVLKEYAEEYEEAVQEEKEWGNDGLNITDFPIFCSIKENWRGDDEDTAENLIKYESWSYSDAKEFEEKSLSWAIRLHEDQLEINWIKETGYTLPFAVGSRVKWRGKSGVIQSDPENHYLKQGKVCVLTDEQAEENQRNQEQGISSRSGGYVVNWEDLELVESQNEQ